MKIKLITDRELSPNKAATSVPAASFALAGKKLAILAMRTLLTTRVAMVAAIGVMGISGMSAALASSPALPAQVGEVSLVLGKAWLRGADGSKELIRIGTRISVQDIIETGKNGLVHVHFVDNAFVSVRASSTLEIIRYDYNQENPSASAVRLDLLEGVTRAISGKAAKEAKDSFRLNTPIAAIGVRGTDFAVSASQNTVRALVNEGSIILAPFSSTCSVDALGPCSQNALELAGGVSQIIEMQASAMQPVYLPLPDASLPASLLEQSAPLIAASGKTEHNETSNNDVYTDSVTTLAVNKKISDSKLLNMAKPLPEFTPDTALGAVDLTTTKSQLVWGRWSESKLSNERITVAYSQALGDGREVTVGNDHYFLSRLEHGSKEVKPGIGVLDFNLTQAQATLNTASGKELMKVNGGMLNIDFEQRQFSTSLQLDHAATGKVNFTDSGRLFSNGIFRNLSDTKTTVGSLSVDGKEAGYFFESTLNAGKIEGITLWGVKP